MKATRNIKALCGLLAVNPLAFYNNMRGLPAFFRDYRKLREEKRREEKRREEKRREEKRREEKRREEKFALRMNYPCPGDRYGGAGIMSGAYFHQDLYVAQRIFRANPRRHVDIGSRIDGFVAHVAAYREIEIMDIRDVQGKVANIRFRCVDLMQLPEGMENYCDSISALHSIEHFGLGRYGDPVDYNGHLKAIRNITKILQNNGTFYFSVPMGAQRIEFNAHRIFCVKYLLSLFEKDYRLVSFSYVDDNGDFHECADLTDTAVNENFGCTFGCAIIEWRKK
jgi:SAM-dependent methyltransferase